MRKLDDLVRRFLSQSNDDGSPRGEVDGGVRDGLLSA